MADLTRDAPAFMRAVLGIDPDEHQVPALRTAAPWVVICGGRRSGKTLTAQVKALHACFVHAGGQVLVVAPNADNARRFVAETAALLHGSELASGAVADEQAMRIDFANGSSLIGLPPTAGQLRGYGRAVVMVVVDEAGFCPPGTVRDARYVLLDRRAEGAQAWLIGSPWGAHDHFFRQAWQRGMDGDSDYFAQTWRTSMNHRLPADWIERERSRLNSIEASAELDGAWPDDGLQYFPRWLLDACTADVELPALGDLAGPARPILGADFGVSYDHSVAVLLYRLAGLDVELPTFVMVPRVWPQGARLSEVVDELVACRAPISYWSLETSGPGAMPAQEIERRVRDRRPTGMRTLWNRVATTAPKKLAAYALVRWLLERGQLVLPRDPTVLRQLAGIRMTTTSHGAARLEAEDAGTHDDVGDALMMAMLPWSPRDGRVECVLGALADPRRAPASAPVPVLDVPMVQTGGGLTMYRRPPLQSVAGFEVTLPAGVRPADVDRAPQLDPSLEPARAALHDLLKQPEPSEL